MASQKHKKTEDGYWPEDLVDETIVPPVRILSEAADELSRRTGGVLTAEPVQIGEPQSGELIYAFYLVADALGGFRYELFRVLVPAQMYPLEIRGGILDTSFHPGDEQAFRKKLQDLCGSGEVRKVVSALVAESKQQSDCPLRTVRSAARKRLEITNDTYPGVPGRMPPMSRNHRVLIIDSCNS